MNRTHNSISCTAILFSLSLVFTHSQQLLQAGTIVDLTTLGNTGNIGVGFFDTNVQQATGTGGFDTFSQQSPQGNGTTSHAYNTTVNNTLDNKASDNFNRSILLSDIPIQNLSGVPHRRFSLDINESKGNGDEFLSLDEIQVFVGGTANSSVTSFTAGILDHDGTLVYRMDTGMDNWVALDYSLNDGSGSGDMFFYLPDSLFDSFSGPDVVTLYSQFGLQGVDPAGFTGNFGASANFEEWGLPAVAVPEPCSLLIMVVSLGFISLRRAC
ncbi:PEP-CTERM sorting domain-containing protein [Bythopirellula polymerisocia]|uniref:PEP-CTERM protein-sorting domain-containing protein n=1 Tax=Bythopirellula polymerisocia TaxID=2528003 RepID=A0A5C6CV09_9BACT|nr:PEP-CTERM sorting domain-containing protein [Bythopirellula polymerisocia]TWU28420.1 hypothetical protein Pla144_17090 [Bythopirellula polymerisocia]